MTASSNSIHVRRSPTILKPDQSRVLLRPFSPGDSQRVGTIIARIMSFTENQVSLLGEKLTVERAEGTATYTSAGRPIAIVSNVMIEYSPPPPPMPARRTPPRQPPGG